MGENEDENHQDRTPITLERWMVQAAFDLVVNSMDFGSGFLVEEDIVAMRALAVAIGVDPDVATPADMHEKFGTPHDVVAVAPNQWSPTGRNYCRKCGKDVPGGAA